MQKDINFYSGLKEIKVKESVSPVVVVLGVLIALSVGLQAGGGLLIYRANGLLLEGIEQKRAYLTDEQNRQLAEDTLQKRAIASLYEQYGSVTAQAYARYYTLPVIDSAGFLQIARCMPTDMKVVGFSMQWGSVIMECESKSEEAPMIFVNALRNTGAMNGIAYNGYTVNAGGVVEFRVSGIYKSGDKK